MKKKIKYQTVKCAEPNNKSKNVYIRLMFEQEENLLLKFCC